MKCLVYNDNSTISYRKRTGSISDSKMVHHNTNLHHFIPAHPLPDKTQYQIQDDRYAPGDKGVGHLGVDMVDMVARGSHG